MLTRAGAHRSDRALDLWVILVGFAVACAGLMTLPATEAHAATITVTSSSDANPPVNGDGCTLREAIQAANSNQPVNECAAGAALPSVDAIAFAVTSLDSTVKTITVSSSGLPSITEAVAINGYSQPGATANSLAVGNDAALKIELDGSGAGPNVAGLTLNGPGIIVRGIIVNRFEAGTGISILSAGSSALLAGNFIGTRADGGRTLYNVNGNDVGIVVDNAPSVTIGGTAPADRNLVSGNRRFGSAGAGIVVSGAGASGVQIKGNYVGTDATGMAIYVNHGAGIDINGAPLATIGGITAGAGNLISANSGSGIWIRGAGANGASVQGNLIGITADGTTKLANAAGVVIQDAPDALVGGIAAGARNVVAGNINYGVLVSGGGSTGARVQGNFIGTNPSGSAAIPTAGAGIGINDAPAALVGGTVAGARNIAVGGDSSAITVFGSGASGTLIQGNYVGTDATGTVGLGGDGISISAPSVTVGGTTVGAGNLIAGNIGDGVSVYGFFGHHALIQGNLIGTDVTGTHALGNLRGISIFGTASATIGGTTSSARNIISGSRDAGIAMTSNVSETVIQGNYIGTNAAGDAALGNGAGGVAFDSASGTVIGGTAAGAGNLISGNTGPGIDLRSSGANGVRIQSNIVGAAANGTSPVGNTGAGIRIVSASNVITGGTAAGEANVIAFNGQAGVSIQTSIGATAGDVIRGNAIHSNGGLGIDLGPAGVAANDARDQDFGANTMQNYPTITSADLTGGTLVVGGTLNSVPNSTFILDFYRTSSCDASGNGEGERFLGSGSAATNADGDATFATTLTSVISPGGAITATATDQFGNTSEFSACFSAAPGVTVSQSGGTSAVTEGGPSDAFMVALTTIPASPVTVTATYPAGSITLGPSDSLTFAADTSALTPQTIIVTAVDNATVDGTRTPQVTFSVTSTDGRYANLTVDPITVTVLDNDTAPVSSALSVANATGAEPLSGTSIISATVTMAPAIAQAVTVQYATASGTATGGGACGAAGVDYVTASGTLTFDPGEVSKPISVTVCADSIVEPDETFTVTLSAPTGGATLAAPASATVTIANTGGTSPTPPTTPTPSPLPLPSPSADSYTLDAAASLEVDAPGVLANDSAVGPVGSLQAQVVSEPAHGSLTLRPNGSFAYTPTAGYSGSDMFTYRVSDGTRVTTAATVSLTIVPNACGNRLRVVQTPVPGGQLQVTIQAGPLANGAANVLSVVTFGTLQNAVVTMNSKPVLNGQAVKLPSEATSATFTLRRATRGQAVTVPFTVTDGCGEWKTFVGGGSGAAGF